MTIPTVLRAIADQIEEAERIRHGALQQLLELAGDKLDLVDGWEGIESPVSPAGAGAEEEPARALSAPPTAPIEQPGQDDALGIGPAVSPETAPGLSPAPVSRAGAVRDGRRPTRSEGVGSTPTPRSTIVACPECGKEVKAVGLGTHRRKAHGYRVTIVDRGPVSCPECGEQIAQRKNLPRHRRTAHGEAAPAPLPEPPTPRAAPWIPAPPQPDSVIRNGRERWLCGRCSESFNTPEKRDEHQRVHPALAPARPPVGRSYRSVVDRVVTGGGSPR